MIEMQHIFENDKEQHVQSRAAVELSREILEFEKEISREMKTHRKSETSN